MIKYIGLDAHSSACTFNVTDERGREADNTTIESNGRLLVKYLRGIEGVKKLTFEECELSNWLYEILRPEVDELIVCNPVANGDYKKKKTEKMEESRQEYGKEIVRCSKGFKEIKYLKSIPGIGSIQAAKIVSQVIDPERFSSKYKYYSYCGLVRHKRISDGRGYGSEKIWGNRILKCVYKMAGHSVLKGKSGLRNYYDTLRLRGISHDNAYNAVCRKIAAISLSVWRKSENYNDRLITGNLIK
ncbi:transposase [Candidatus Jettenia caeni]|uniref:Transposase n=2 Tax=Candidatus Jettenia caeni TaxID=247490 RepID=I3IPM9_9BACT|nr:transposase [Candidatus Jettenia caeni]